MRDQQHDQGQTPPGQREQSGSNREQSGGGQGQMKKQPTTDKGKASLGNVRNDAKLFPEDDKSTK